MKGVPAFFVENRVWNDVRCGWFIGKECVKGVIDDTVELLRNETQWIPGQEEGGEYSCFFDGRSFLFKESKYITGRQAVRQAIEEYKHQNDELVLYPGPIPVVSKNGTDIFWLVGGVKEYKFIKILVNALTGLVFSRSDSAFEERFELAALDDDRFCYE